MGGKLEHRREHSRRLPRAGLGWMGGLGGVIGQTGFGDYLLALELFATPQLSIISRIMSPNTTAVVLIEYQNDFTSPGGKLHDAVKPVMESTKMLENTVEMVKEARKAGATIVYVPIHFAPGFNEMSRDPYGILKGCKDGQVFEKGSWGAEIVDVLKPQPGDIVVEGKRGLDGFATTNLDFILRSRKIDTIALSGFLTNCCVESTMRTGYELGYNVVTIKDCAATVNEEAQKGAIEHDFPMFSHPMTHHEFVEALSEA